ncbi:DUF805 domain-containing protein [Sphingomonas sp.]|jgi:uncharacterized membrane protein YhaH (DUF805 family)|uniref:DUF805 domain-containing protein n=1 Tax=Sphingomonas sp. TaxID=28214 RepID=UPI002D7E5581|nr:DUF805 domain-containing protein [Sphingomonas sp.]HEU0044580.1 DUF805 domain-containing protein [Sphingomonas sp.]
MEWMLMPLRRYADFSGRSRRKEYWMFALGVVIVFTLTALLLGVVLGATSGGADPAGGLSGGALGGSLVVTGLLMLLGLAIFIPSLAVQVRRFHDQDRSGWMVLINLIPYLGGLVVLVFMCLPGTVGENRYGLDPLAGERGGAGVPTSY